MGKNRKPLFGHRKTSLRRGFIAIVVLCWTLPVLLISLVTGLRYQKSMSGKIENLMQDELKNFMALTRTQMEECITISKKLSYDGTIENAWWNRQEGKVSDMEFYRVVMGDLRNRFYNDRRFRMAAFYLTEAPEEIYYVSSEDSRNLAGYRERLPEGEELFREIEDSYAHLQVYGEKLYLVRNLYTTTGYTRFGTLILELDQKELFSGVTRSSQTEIVLFFNQDWNQCLYADALSEKDREICRALPELYQLGGDQVLTSGARNGYQTWLYQIQDREYHLAAAMLVDANKAYSELRTMRLLLAVLIVVSLPVLGYTLFYTGKHITRPVQELIRSFHSLESGKFGEHLEENELPNAEFQELGGSFNRMSDELSYLFDTVYKEKLARKDAAIIALQSQINPHFLNNTLEMMNWQARMAGDTVVSKMIEALATLLDYSMDRRNRKMISVAEEIRCADAYFYIISMRFGQRIQIEKDCDPELMQQEVPRLILQPLLENAVFHGVEKKNQGKITLRIYRREDEMILKVTNTGRPLTGEDKDHIRRILEHPEREKSETEKDSRVSIGIRNVNERIRLIYGDEYGLTIFSEDTGETSAMLRIPLKGAAEGREQE